MAGDEERTTTPFLAGVVGTVVVAALARDCFGAWQAMGGLLLLALLVSQWQAVPSRLGLELVYCLALGTALVLTLGIAADHWQFAGQCAGVNRARDMTFLVLWADFTLLFALLRWFTAKIRKG